MVTESTSICREMTKRPIFKITGYFSENTFISDISTASIFAKSKRLTAFHICYVMKTTFKLEFGEMCL